MFVTDEMKLEFRKYYANSPESLEKALIMLRKMGQPK